MTKPSPADCDRAFRRLYDYLDGELRADEVSDVEAHLAVCEVCATEFAFESRVVEEIRTRARAAPVPEGLKERIRAVLEAARQRDSPR